MIREFEGVMKLCIDCVCFYSAIIVFFTEACGWLLLPCTMRKLLFEKNEEMIVGLIKPKPSMLYESASRKAIS